MNCDMEHILTKSFYISFRPIITIINNSVPQVSKSLITQDCVINNHVSNNNLIEPCLILQSTNAYLILTFPSKNVKKKFYKQKYNVL